MEGPFKLLEGEECDNTTPVSNIMNLSRSYRLSEVEMRVLELGLTFIPTPKQPDRRELRRDLHTYHRRLKLLDHFKYESHFPHVPFTDPSSWVPREVAAPVETLVQKDLECLKRYRPKPEINHNLNTVELQAINTLANNPAIVIKPADKGSQIVIMDRTQYLLEADRQLTNRNHYAPLLHSMQPETQNMIKNILCKMYQEKIITLKQMTYLLGPDVPRPRLFYLLPKIHKALDKWTVPGQIPCGRPIVSDCGSESSNIAEFLDFHINPLSQRHASFVKDTYDFVEKVGNISVSADAFLFSIDINSLYTNIDTTLGLQSVRAAFSKFPVSGRPDDYILELLEISLSRNDFEFNKKHYLQIHGTAMGKKFAPAYANLYMCGWEESAFLKCAHLPSLYFRYLDDIFGIWEGDMEQFLVFLDILNSHHPTITITHNIQKEKLEFLDTQVFFIPGLEANKTLATKVFFKETDRHALLHKQSYHPKHTYRGLVKSQLIRFHRICTYLSDVEEATSILFKALRPRGYSRRFLREIKQEVRTIFEVNGRYVVEREAKEMIPVVTTYSQPLGRLGGQLRLHFQQAQADLGDLGRFKLISAYRRNKNLKDRLVHSNLNGKPAVSPEENNHFNWNTYIGNRYSGRGVPIRNQIAFGTPNTVYAIRCARCQKLYIGETKHAMQTRLTQHKYQVRRGNEDTVLYRHFIAHGVLNMRIEGLESQKDWSRAVRQKAERTWIHLLKTIDPLGLNEKY